MAQPIDSSPIIEAVPNFSEGRDSSTIDALKQAVTSVPEVRLLHYTSDPDHNRTVLTFAGPPVPVAEAAFRAVAVAVERIDLRKHIGVHPRIGAADVLPFVPIRGIDLPQCAQIAEAVGARVWNELGLPVYLYEAAARDPGRKRLEQIRSRSFVGQPDIGSGRHPSAGALVTGARPFLIAWNVNLRSRDLTAAHTIARRIRESSGGLPAVKALGLELASRGQVQVSINLTDFETTPLHVVYELVRHEAQTLGVEIEGVELIGLLPQRALELSQGYDIPWEPGTEIATRTVEFCLAR